MTVTNPTLAGGASKSFASSSSATLTLYGVQSENISKSSNLIDFPMPTMDSDQKIMMDLMGVSRTIDIEGIVTVSNVANLSNYAKDIAGLGANTLIFGNQGSNGGQAGYTYTSEILSRGGSNVTIRVYVADAKVAADKGNPNSFSYTISLVECSSTNSI